MLLEKNKINLFETHIGHENYMKESYVIVHFFNSSFFIDFDILEFFPLILKYFNNITNNEIFIEINIDYDAMNSVISSFQSGVEPEFTQCKNVFDILNFFNIQHSSFNNFYHFYFNFCDAIICEEIILNYYNQLSLSDNFQNFNNVKDNLKKLTLQLALENDFNLFVDYDYILKSTDEEIDALIISLCHLNEIYVYYNIFLNEQDYELMHDKYKIEEWWIKCRQTIYNSESGVSMLDDSDLELYQGCIYSLNIKIASSITHEGLEFLYNTQRLSIDYINIEQISLQYLENVEYLSITRCKEIMFMNQDLIHLENIKYLELDQDTNITDDGLEYLENIITLSSQHNDEITDSGLEHLKCIKSLNLNYNENITNDGLEHLKYIESLNLNYNKNITDEGLEYLKCIKTLHLNENENITDDGLEYLKCIKTLEMDSNKNITDEGLEHLENVQYLDLSINEKITKQGTLEMQNLKKIWCHNLSMC